ncbi:MAG: hypothetical protein GEU80_14780 [Dehalococcoidia bacterium]|nr:hypothetical protein [Dehalococcoidia bacterium]
MATEEQKQTYRDALADWQRKLDDVHALLLDGQRMPPDRIKGLLNREARAKAKYDSERRRLLGIPEEGDEAAGEADDD